MLVLFLSIVAKSVVTLFVALLVLVSGGFWAAKLFADGPIGPIPGGRLESGPLDEDGEIDPASIENRNVELQLVDPPTSRLTGLFLYEGDYYVPCDLGFMQPRVPHDLMRRLGRFAILAKRWHEDALRDGRAVVRVDGKRYERRLVRVTDAAEVAALRELTERKATAFFGEPLRPVATDPEAIWFFRLEPR